VVYSGLTLRSPRSGRVLINDLSVTIPRDTHVLVRGRDETARSALFLSTIGLWDAAEGRIGRPSLEQILLVTELPYLPPGTLRELLMRPWSESPLPWRQNLSDILVPEEQIMETLAALKIDTLVKGFGGLDQRPALGKHSAPGPAADAGAGPCPSVTASLRVPDRPSSALGPERVDLILDLLNEALHSLRDL